MSHWQEANERLDRTRIYLVGSNEWTEMMCALYQAAVSALSIEAYNVAGPIIGLMEDEIEAVEEQGRQPYEPEITRRLSEYRFGEDFSDGDNQVDPRFRNW